MSAQRAIPFITPEEYLAIERAADFKSEYYSGEMVAMSGASHRHEKVVVNLTRELSNALRHQPCQPNGGNLRVRVRNANYLYPDLSVVCGKEEFADDEHLDTLLNPTVIFEVLSESTESRDRGLKWRLYQEIRTLSHYVMLNQETARVEVFTRHNNVDWLVHAESGLSGVVSLPAIGVTLAMADLYENVALDPDRPEPQ